MSVERNKVVIRRLNDEIWNGKDEGARVRAVDELFSPDLVAHRSGRPALSGLARMREFARVVPRIYGDCRAEIDDVIAVGDRVVTRWRITGTQEGELLGIPPTGKPLSFTGITIHRVVDGKIAEMWAEEDWLGAARQLGAEPTRTPPGERAVTTSDDENVAVVRRHFDLLGHHDEADGDAIWAEDIVFREPQQVIRGREAGKKRYRAFREAFPDIGATLHEVVAQGDYVAVRYTLEGTHEGPFAGAPATGRRATLSGMGVFRLAGGRIAEGWGCADFYGFLQQLGTLPAPPATGRGGARD